MISSNWAFNNVTKQLTMKNKRIILFVSKAASAENYKANSD